MSACPTFTQSIQLQWKMEISRKFLAVLRQPQHPKHIFSCKFQIVCNSIFFIIANSIQTTTHNSYQFRIHKSLDFIDKIELSNFQKKFFGCNLSVHSFFYSPIKFSFPMITLHSSGMSKKCPHVIPMLIFNAAYITSQDSMDKLLLIVAYI